jgi:hypothetical protein
MYKKVTCFALRVEFIMTDNFGKTFLLFYKT